jgi:cardiolipin synthase
MASSPPQKTIHLTNAYFVPDEQTVEALTNAQRRGVDVQIILLRASDQSAVFYAGRSFYSHLLKSRAKLYERRTNMLHAKSAVIEGVWSTVGSTNMDLWSFLRNDEVNVIILSAEFAEEMERIFQDDLQQFDKILYAD